MTYAIGVALFICTGYSLVLLLGISRRHLLHDLALSWFVGAGYYSVVLALLVYLAGVPVSRPLSFVIIALPILFILLRSKLYLTHIRESFINARETKYIPTGWTNMVPIILIIYSILVFVLIVIHGASTPSSGDDSLDLRAVTPFLVYGNDFSIKANELIMENGIWPSFVTVLFYHLQAPPDHFYINYTILTSLFFFLTLLYVAPSMRGANNQGIYNVFLVLSLPLFIYHSTITYADVRLAMPYGLGFLFFAFYVKELDNRDLKISVLFFLITSLIKSKGVIPGLSGLTLCVLFSVYMMRKQKIISLKKVLIMSLPFFMLTGYLFLLSEHHASVLKITKSIPHVITGTFATESNIEVMRFIEHGVTDGLYKLPVVQKFSAFMASLFTSGNFGILFYILAAGIVLNFRKIVSTRLVWEFGFLMMVFLETMIFMVVIAPISIDDFPVLVHRTVLVLSVISAVYLSSLMTRGEA